MKFANAAIAASMVALAAAAPTKTIEKRAEQCGQYDSVATGSYTVYNDLWGESGASSGSQCFEVTKLSGSTISWDTTWSWTGGSGVKSYANVVVNSAAKQLSAIKTINSVWDWSYSGSNIVADVAYDMFTSSTASGSNQFEIMVWLAAIGGAGAISSTYGSNGAPTPVATATIDGHSWNLYKGPNGSTTVYSFVPASGEITAFSGDLKAFFTYLINNEGFSSSQYLTSLGAGTEATTGTNAKFTVSAYSVTVS